MGIGATVIGPEVGGGVGVGIRAAVIGPGVGGGVGGESTSEKTRENMAAEGKIV